MALPRPLCTRLPAPLEGELERRFEALGWSPSRGLREVVHEWLATARFPAIEFRDTAFGRRAAIRAGPEVWEVAAVAGADRLPAPRVESHFAWVAPALLAEALAYAREYPGEIDRLVEANRRFAGKFRS